MGIEFRNVSFAYASTPHADMALNNVSFTIDDGQFAAVIGRGGSGKTTLLSLLSGLEEPSKGEITITLPAEAHPSNATQQPSQKKAAPKTRHINKRAPRPKHSVGFMLQHCEQQLFASTVFDDVAFGPRNLGLAPEEVQARVKDATEAVGLSLACVGSTHPFQLSGGEQRRVALAGILALRPAILALDEPMAGLDPKAHKEFTQTLRRLHQNGLIIVMVSHLMNDVARLAQKVLVLDQGSLIMAGSVEEVFGRWRDLQKTGLKRPTWMVLADSLRKKGMSLSKTYYQEDELIDALAMHFATTSHSKS